MQNSLFACISTWVFTAAINTPSMKKPIHSFFCESVERIVVKNHEPFEWLPYCEGNLHRNNLAPPFTSQPQPEPHPLDYTAAHEL